MDLNCPYCKAELQVNHDDGFGYEENVKHQMDCDACERNFVFTTYISFSYEAERADCLNGMKHAYELSKTAPIEFSEMICKCCDDTRELTEKERIDFGIGTKQNYFDKLRE